MMQIWAKTLPIPIEPPPGGLHSPQYDVINPIGKIPALMVDGAAIPESQVICDLLEELYPEDPLRPAEPIARARCALIARIVDLYVMNPMLPLFANLDPATRDQAVVDRVAREVAKGLGWLDQAIAPGPYACGERFSLADCAAVPVLEYVLRFMPIAGLADPLAGHARLSAYWDAIGADPHAAKARAALADALSRL
jgi:glutathione S-transferase